MIPLDSPLLDGNERKYLNECIDTNWISWQGRFVNDLEKSIASYCGTKHGIAVVNGTYALVIALQALGVGEGDEVIVPAFTMSATTFAISATGATPVWADCSEHSLTLDPSDVAQKITNKTKAIVAVHLYGYAADIPKLLEVADGIPIVEDAAESFGATIDNKPVGGLGTIACHSFHNKIIGSGEGGAITTNDSNLSEMCLELRTPPPDNYGGKIFALNNRMSNISAAVALAQLERVDLLIEKRRRVAKLYDESFKNIKGIELFKERSNERAVYWRYQIMLKTIPNSDMVDQLKLHGIESRTVFKLMSEHPLYGIKAECPNAKYISDSCIDIPSGPSLTDEQIYTVIKSIKNIINK